VVVGPKRLDHKGRAVVLFTRSIAKRDVTFRRLGTSAVRRR
jgi:hypothetical protein